MDRLLWQYRFRDTWNRVRIGNRKFRFRADDWSAIALRGNIASQRPNAREVTWLLPFRRVLRKIIRFEPRIALALIIDSTDDEFLRRLAFAFAANAMVQWTLRSCLDSASRATEL